MNCPGVHCPGCSGGQSAGIAVAAIIGLVAAYEAVPWVAAHIWWIGSTVAVCFAVAVAAAMWLGRWADRRGARFAEAHGILSRADVIEAEVLHAEVAEPVRVVVEPPPERPAIAPPSITVNIFGQPDAGQAAVIRQAIERTR